MSIEFNCFNCRKVLKAPENAIGKKAKCPHCGGISTVNRLSDLDPPEMLLDEENTTLLPDELQATEGVDLPLDELKKASPFPTGTAQPNPNDPLLGNPAKASHQATSYSASHQAQANYNQPSYNEPSYNAPLPSSSGGYSPGFVQPSRASNISNFGIISLITGIMAIGMSFSCCCCFPINLIGFGLEIVFVGLSIGLGLTAVNMAKTDLKRIQMGEIENFGVPQINSGKTFGGIGAILGATAILISITILVVAFVFYGAILLSDPPKFGGRMN